MAPGGVREAVLRGVPADVWRQADATAVPVKHPGRVRRPAARDGPGGLRTRLRLRRGASVVVLRLPAGAAHRPGPWVIRTWGLVRPRWMSGRWPTPCWKAPPRRACPSTTASSAAPGRWRTGRGAPVSSTRPASPSGGPCRRPPGTPSRACATGSRRPRASSPRAWARRATAPRRCGGCSPAHPPRSWPTLSSGSRSCGRCAHITRLRAVPPGALGALGTRRAERPGTAPLRACADGGRIRSAPYGRGYGDVRSRPLHSPQRAGDSRMTRALRGKQKASAAQQGRCAK